MDQIKIVARNRSARHNYSIEDTYEAGIVLQGTEIKSIRAGRVNLKGGYVMQRGEALWLMDVHIAPYKQAGLGTHAPTRPRKLLLHRKQIERLIEDVQRKGYTLVPLRMYLRGNYAKVEIGVAKGKRQYDKRQAIIERDHQRRMQRELKKFRHEH
ncbi:MAG: SsrA-binding protein SmpB [Chloroflexota bacterium]|nr:SsrA-binding protein SmpB [Chloroflexota bacterium]